VLIDKAERPFSGSRERLTELGRAPRYAHALDGFEQDADGVSARVSPATPRTSIRRPADRV
jgi:hypothetical protein